MIVGIFLYKNINLASFRGIGVEKDEKTAFDWYKKSAERGWEDAQIALGDCYQYGKGVEADDAQAYYWYVQAQGERYALCHDVVCSDNEPDIA